MKLHVFLAASLSSLAIVLTSSAESPVRADDLRVLPEASARTRSSLYRHLLKQAESAIDRRTQTWEQIKTAEQARVWQKQRREIFLRQLGPFPERTPLNAKVTGMLPGDSYRVEKVIYESRPNHHVTALLYLPNGKPPYPGVLVPCGHSLTGKAAEPYQRVSILLARNGLAALCYDPIGQGERYQCFDADGKPLEADYAAARTPSKQLQEIPGHPHFSSTEEHTLVGVGSILLGTNTANYRIWDGMRGIDYLVSRPDIDAKRIGCTGISGGGTLTSYLMALDERIACAAPGCFPTTFRSLLRVAGPQDAEQNIFGQLALGLDEADYVHLRAPKPTAILAGTRDGTFDILGTWDVFREAKRFYARLDHPERVDLVEADAPHGFTTQLRVGAVRWMRRWLLGKDDAITEAELPIPSAQDLWCTPKGQVLFLSGERSVFDLNRERETALAKQRADLWKKTPRPQMLNNVRKIVGVRSMAALPALSHRLVGIVPREGYAIHKLALKVDDDLELPALAFVPPQPNGDAYLYLHGDGKQVDAGADGPIVKLVRQNHLVLAVDLSGLGETVGRHPRNWGHSLFGANAQEFFLAYLLGKSLVGLRTENTLACGRFLAGYRMKDEQRKVHLIGIGTAGVPALHAAALEPAQFASLTLRRTLASWSSVLRTSIAGNHLSLAVHGALRTYDLPDLLRQLDAKRTIVEEPLNANGKPADSPKQRRSETTNSLGMKLVYIESGKFTMGTGDSPPKTRQEWLQRDDDEAPAHTVTIAKPFFLSVHEVTNAQYEQFDPKHKKWRGQHGGSEADGEPVTFVTWHQGADFCAWLSKKEGKPYRLPTEAEWEYACRSGTTSPFHTGDKLTAEQANLGKDKDGKSLDRAVKVGSYKANAWGLHDMHGNVAEWCSDWYGPYEAKAQTDPVGRADGYARVVRGWSYLRPARQDATRFARSANRSGHLPEDANRYTGFRVVQADMPKSKPLPVAAPPLNQKNVKQTSAPAKTTDPAKPYFLNYADGDKNPSIPPETWGPIFSKHNHYSAVCACPNGDILAVWYTCAGEPDRQLAQAASRLRAGSDRWEPASLFFRVPDVNCHAPVLLRDGNRIYHFCTQSLHGWDYASNIVRWSDDSGATWSKPRIMLPRTAADHLSQPCSAFVAADGALVLACDGDKHEDERLIVSTDKGKTWKVAKGDMRQTAGKYVIHPAIAPRADGAVLCFLRGPNPMPLLISKDRGDTWEMTASPFPGISGGQKASALRLSSGAILLLTAYRNKKLGGDSLVALSLDDGKTWPHARKVEAPVKGYMSLAQGPDGTIYLIGSGMQFAACNEAWIREGKPWPSKGEKE